MRKVILMISVVVIGLIIYSLFSTENINSLSGDFEQVAFKRNKNNTGPVQRMYVFTVKDTLWSEMAKHADLLPHTKYGSTEVYYFLKGKMPKNKLNLTLSGLDSASLQYCIAHASKDGQSREKFKKHPF